jgi:predicted GIY-YIG superfamily endonuclease
MKLDPNARGTVYLVHFSGLTSQNRQHYLGWSADLSRRFAQHASGRGAHETRKALAEGLKIMLAQTWSGTPDLERRIKQWSRRGAKGFAGLCPYCARGAKLPDALARELGPPTYTVRWTSPSDAATTAGDAARPISGIGQPPRSHRESDALGIALGIESSRFERIDADRRQRAHHPAIGSRKPKTPENRGLAEAGDRGVEPRVAVLETTVLPIHQSPGESEL